MEVPFISSGAINRAHYALVRKVEAATSSQLADQYILAEVVSIRDQLVRSNLTLKQCKECLIILLYCSMNLHAPPDMDLEFALHHAVNLAEAGQTIQDKRTGYLFCAEVMPREHELQLMLVNTIRKDLESVDLSRICLALDTLIQFSSEDVIPAIRTRLLDLSSHNSPHVRRRVLLAFHRLSRHDPNLLGDIVTKAQKRLMDQEAVVACAALTLCSELVKREHLPKDKYHHAISKLLVSTWRTTPDPVGNRLVEKLIESLPSATLTENDLRVILDIVQFSARRGSSANAMLHQCFSTLSDTPPELLLKIQRDVRSNFADHIRHLLASEDPNDIYVFISCLRHLHPMLWAGISTDVPAILEEWEVERVMKLLDSENSGVRRKTLEILQRVDPSIVGAYYARMIAGEVSGAVDFDEMSRRLLQVIEVVSGGDGETYSKYFKIMLQTLESKAPMEKRQVLQGVIEDILVHIRNGSADFKIGCIGSLFISVTDTETEIGPSLMVILAALITEHLRMSSISPSDLLDGLTKHISMYSASVQDACLLCMIRVAIDCDQIPPNVTDAVRSLHDRSGRYIRRRCDQFLKLTSDTQALKLVVRNEKTSSLPDFAAALEKYELEPESARTRSPQLIASQSPERPISRNTRSPSKLRYDAYAPPKPVKRLRRLSSSSSRASDESGSKFLGQSRDSRDALSRTLTPGDLALAALGKDLEYLSMQGSPPPVNPALPIVQILDEDDSTTRADLIALDSPFVSEPVTTISNVLGSRRQEFESTWNRLEAFNARGWCECQLDEAVKKLYGMQRHVEVISAEDEPFQGELKLMLSESQNPGRVALLRLKPNDEGCLWRLRCEDEQLRKDVKGALSDA